MKRVQMDNIEHTSPGPMERSQRRAEWKKIFAYEATPDRRSDLSYREFVEEYRNQRRPVIISGYIKRWPAYEQLTPQRLKARFGKTRVPIHGGRSMELGGYLDRVAEATLENPAPYLKNVHINRVFPALLEELEPGLLYARPDRLSSRLLPPNWLRQRFLMELFIGGPGTRFPVLHYDIYMLHNFISQTYGEKIVYLFPPDQSDYLYPDRETPEYSQVDDMQAPDLARFPLFAYATPYIATLKPGDTLFIPYGWWHTTLMTSPSVSIGVSSLDGTNWEPFIKDVFRRGRAARPILSIAKWLYLKAVGRIMDRLEARSSPDFDRLLSDFLTGAASGISPKVS